MKHQLDFERLITRDDGDRFKSKKKSIEEMQELYYQELEANNSLGGDSTLNIKHFMKSLSSLAGGDDSIFLIIDDRFDVWTEEVK